MTPTMPAEGRSTQAANSFQTRLSEAVSEAVARRRTNPKALPGPVLQPVPESQKPGAVRQNSAARIEKPVPAAAMVTPFTPTGSGPASVTTVVATSNPLLQPA